MWAILQKKNDTDYCLIGVIKDEQVAKDFVNQNNDLFSYTFCPDIDEEIPIKIIPDFETKQTNKLTNQEDLFEKLVHLDSVPKENLQKIISILSE